MRSTSLPRAFLLLALAIFLALPAVAADGAIYGGIDTWVTTPGTHFDFASEPLPAGFFCRGSAPFTGRIDFLGLPIATGEPGALGETDTIVQRLDDAAFDKRGVATTRLQIKALSLRSVQPIETECGLFMATVSLDGVQPITTMRIMRTNKKGGRYIAPVGVGAKVTFTPMLDRNATPLVAKRQLQFLSPLKATWSFREGKRALPSLVLVDTDGDSRPETYLPSSSNFAPRGSKNCHDEGGGAHCMSAEITNRID